ncbi:hypothetical protein ALC57_11282, partial [Trachymyrmex cornetzi]
TGFQLMGGQVDNEEYLRVSEIAEKRVLSWIKISSAERPTLIFLEFRFTDFRSVTFTTAKRAFGKLAFFFRPGRRWMRAGGLQGGTENGESKPGRVGREGGGWVCISRQFVGTSIVFVVCVFYKTTNESYGDTVVMTATEKRCFVGANEVNALLNTHNKAARGGVNNPATPDESNLNCIVKAIYGFSGKRPKLGGYCTAMQDKRCG